MKFSVISAAGVFTAVVGAKECRSNTCFRAIVSDTPDIGEAFCSSYLGREPLETVIETVTAVLDFVESRTYTISELSTTTEEITAATVTIPTSTLTAYGKRGQSSVQSLVQSSGGAQPSNPASASIVSVCKDNSVLISSICNHILPTPIAPTSTLIIEEAYTKTESVEYIVTSIGTVTTTVTATAYAVATQYVQPIANGDFQGPFAPTWSSTISQTGGNVEWIPGGNVCVDTGSNCHSSTIIRVTPPVTGGRYAGIVQTFKATPSTTYKLSILLNSRYGGSAAGGPGIQVLYNGVNLGIFDCNANGVALYFQTISMWEFTTDESGTGTLELRVLNRSGSAGAYFYIDDIKATIKL